MSRDYALTMQVVDEWAASHQSELFGQLPFNPTVVKNAFQDIAESDNVLNWKSMSRLFDSDAQLTRLFISESQQLAKGRENVQINTVERAFGILGHERILQALQMTLSDKILDQFKSLDFVFLRNIWKESWALGYASRELAETLDLESSVAYHAGVCADIGLLCLYKIFGKRYLSEIDLMLAEEGENRFGTRGEKRVELEKACFGADHCEVGCYLLSKLGFQPEFYLAALRHEDFTSGEVEIHDIPLTVTFACKMAQFITMEERFQMMNRGNPTAEQETSFSNFRIQHKFGLKNKFKNSLNIPETHFNVILDRVQTQVKSRLIEAKEAGVSPEDEYNAMESLRDIKKLSGRVFAKLAQFDPISEHLPHPLAYLYDKVRVCRKSLNEISSENTKMLMVFTHLLDQLALGFALHRLRTDVPVFVEAVKKALNCLSKGRQELSLGLGMGVQFALQLVPTIRAASTHPEGTAAVFCEFLETNRKALFQVCQDRTVLKWDESSAMETLEGTRLLLRNFSALKFNYWSILSLIFNEIQENFDFEYLSWMGSSDLSLKPIQKSPKPSSKALATSEKSLLIAGRGSVKYFSHIL